MSPMSSIQSTIRPFTTRAFNYRKTPKRLFVILTLLILTAAFALSAAAQTNFESPTFTTGTVHNQNGWSSQGASGGGCAIYDHLINANAGAPLSFGGQSLRISDAATSGCFDGTYSASLANEAGETAATSNGMSGGTRQTHFEFQFSLASAVAAEQSGLLMSVAPDRGDGARMSYLRFEDHADGIHVYFQDFVDAAPFGTSLGDDAGGCGAEDDFIETDLATFANRTTPHSLKFVVDFVNGPRNDVVKIYIDGLLVKTGTSWEDYYRYCAEQAPNNQTHTVDSLGFHTRAAAHPANAGKGFLIDNILTSSGPATSTVTVHPADLVNAPNASTGWLFYNDETDVVDNTLGSFVAGPGAPPLGTGGVRISVTGSQKRNLATYQFSGTPLADISTLKYSTYNPSAGNGGGGSNRSGYFQFNVDFNGSDTWQRRLVFLPSDNGGVTPDSWKEWDTINGGNAVWRYSGGTFPGGGSTKTWNQILAAYPGIRMRVTDSFLGIRVGEPYPDGYTENIDAIKLGTAAGTTQFDFDPVTPTATINQAAGQADPTSTSPINFTVAFSEPVTGFTSSDVVLSGTAGATTKVVTGGPTVYNVAVGGMTTSGTVIAAVGAGAANASGSGASTAAATSTDNSVTYYTCNNITLPVGVTKLRNSVLTVPITVDSVSGRGIYSFDYTFTYNSAVISPQATPYDQTGTVSSGYEITYNIPTPGTLIVSGFGSTPLTGNGTLINLKFNVYGAIGTNSPLGIGSFAFNEGVPCVNPITTQTMTVVSGTISGLVTYLNNTSAPPVPGVVVTASGAVVQTATTDIAGLYSLSGLGNSAYTVTPSKTGDLAPGGINAISGNDASRIAQHVVFISPFTPGGGAFKSADVSGNGTITSFDASMVARFVVALPDTGATGTWRFEPVNTTYTIPQVETGVSNQNYSAILMGDVTGNWNDTTPNPTRPDVREEDRIRINAPTTSVRSGAEMVIPVQIANLNRKDIISYQFELAYSPKVIRPAANPCDVLGTVSKDLSVTCNAETAGLLRVVVFGVKSLENDGVLLNLKFAAIGSAGSVSALTFKGMLLNEGEPQIRATDGEITITGASTDSDSIGGRLITSTGEAVTKAQVILTSGSGEIRLVYVNELGYFNFDKVTIGETYVISVESSSHKFTPQTVSAGEGVTQLTIIAEQ